MKFNYNDGGRADTGYKGKTGDCERPYKEIYDLIMDILSMNNTK